MSVYEFAILLLYILSSKITISLNAHKIQTNIKVQPYGKLFVVIVKKISYQVKILRE